MSHGDIRSFASANAGDVDAGDAVNFHSGDLEGVHHGTVAGRRGGHEIEACCGDDEGLRGGAIAPEVGDGIACGERSGRVGTQENMGAGRNRFLHLDHLRRCTGTAIRGGRGHGVGGGLLGRDNGGL